VELVNTSPAHNRELIIQAGAFGEHTFTTATELTGEHANQPQDVNQSQLRVALPAGRSIKLQLGARRYSNRPSYFQPV
jgi:hypothetical protein